VNAAHIKKVLKNKILNSNVVLAISGIYASYSDWIEWKIITSYNNSVPINGVAPWGQEKISRTVTDYSIADVRWNTESIVNAIKTHVK
jgi:hypothetical protein